MAIVVDQPIINSPFAEPTDAPLPDPRQDIRARRSKAPVRVHARAAVAQRERQVAIALDESSHVRAWVKNAKLSFTIPYEHQGRRHEFTPDFVVALSDPRGEPSDDHLVVEVKGLEREADRSKDVGAQRWIAAVNHWGKLGRWRYAKIHSPHDLTSVLNSDPGPTR